jgi:DNA-binding NarL/FixJ family response regulator
MEINIALVEDDQHFREYFSNLFIDDSTIHCTAIYNNAEDLVAEFPNIQVDVIFMDIQLPQMNGIECISVLKAIRPSTLFVVYTVFEDADTIFKALCAGATGYLLKSSNMEQIKSAVFEIVNGGSPMSNHVARKVIESFHVSKTTTQEQNVQFSETENTILSLLSNGYRYKDISLKLNITVDDIKRDITRIYDKLQVKSRSQALRITVDSQHLSKQYVNSYLNDNEANTIKLAIQNYLEKNKPFLDDRFSLKQLSAALNIQPHFVSQVINQKMKCNFFELINHYRIEYAKTQIATAVEFFTIEGLGYDCGFGSKTSFHSVFKKHTGQTPLEYLKTKKSL